MPPRTAVGCDFGSRSCEKACRQLHRQDCRINETKSSTYIELEQWKSTALKAEALNRELGASLVECKCLTAGEGTDERGFTAKNAIAANQQLKSLP
jgi:hypothetical protein